MRVVVCGSRDFDDFEVVDFVLTGFVYEDQGWPQRGPRQGATIIQGECPYGGADELAKDWAHANGVYCESFPPKSNTAQHFHERNRAMIDSGADLCVAFVNKPLTESRGTLSTVEYARRKGVKTIVIHVDG